MTAIRATSASAGLEPRLLLRGALGGRDRLEPLVRNRLPTLDGEAVCPLGEPLFRALDRLELGAEPLGEAEVQLLVVQLCRRIRRLVLIRQLAGIDRPEIGERPLDPLALGAEKLPGPFGIHSRDATRFSPGESVSGALRCEKLWIETSGARPGGSSRSSRWRRLLWCRGSSFSSRCCPPTTARATGTSPGADSTS